MSETRPSSPTGASLVGEVLGNYRLISELGTGGMGTVYRGQHELLGRVAAVKVLRDELSSNDALVQRFFNEAKAATAIRHPGIVEVYDFGYTEDGRAFLVMELLEGESLHHRIERRGRLTELECATIARGVAGALKAAHAKNIVHRDLKPDNVFLVADSEGGDRPKVLDFGVAKLADPAPANVRHTQTGALMGTPLYMAPEQARAAGMIDHRADLYSLGCMMYEMLVGSPPFVADGAGEIIALQLFGQVQRPSERLAEITPEMDAIVMRLLEKEPHDRFQTAADVATALSSVGAKLSARLSAELGAAESRPQLIMPTPMPTTGGKLRLSLLDEPPPQPEKRSSALPIVAGVLTVLIAAGAGIFAMSRGGEDEKPKQPETVQPVVETAKPPVEVKQPPPPVEVKQSPPVEVKQTPPENVQTPPVQTKKKPDRLTTKGGGEKPTTTTTPESSGPVVKPDTTPAAQGSGATTHPGMHTSEGAPIEPDLGPPPPKKDP